MQLPKEPTVLPRGRTYTRSFEPETGKVYRSGSQLVIQVPPIDRTYLTKATQLHFSTVLTYKEAKAQELHDWFKQMTQIDKDTFRQNGYETARFNQPLPMLDINGPYGLISQLDVYDYLGTTLLETIVSHDVLTATLTDYWFQDSELELNRPIIQDLSGNVRKRPGSLMSNLSRADYQQSGWGFTLSGNNVVDGTKTTTANYSINLVSFLGMLSDSFVPLHNGFTIKFTVNNPSKCIHITNSLNGVNLLGNNEGSYKSQQITPSIVDYYISNAVLRTRLLEVPVEVDDKVNKLVFTKQFKYNPSMIPIKTSSYEKSATAVNPRPDVSYENWGKYTARLPVEVKSLTKVFVAVRPLYRPEYENCMQLLGYRITNNIQKASLLLDKAVLVDIVNPLEANYQAKTALGIGLDPIYNYEDFTIANMSSLGTQGKCAYIYSAEEYGLSEAAGSQDLGGVYPTALVANGEYSNFFQLQNTQQGKFLWAFDLRLPGYEANAVMGIDSSERILELQLESNIAKTERHIIDIFAEYDALIHVEPGKLTTVSF